jgi:hypothetical protein
MQKEYRVVRTDMRGIFKCCKDRDDAVRVALGLRNFMYWEKIWDDETAQVRIESRRHGLVGNDSTWSADPITDPERALLVAEINEKRERIARARQGRKENDALPI